MRPQRDMDTHAPRCAWAHPDSQQPAGSARSPRSHPPAMGMKRQRSWTAMVGASQSSWMLSSGCRAGSSTGGSAAGVEKQEEGAKALIHSAGYQSLGRTSTGGHRCRRVGPRPHRQPPPQGPAPTSLAAHLR